LIVRLPMVILPAVVPPPMGVGGRWAAGYESWQRRRWVVIAEKETLP